MINRLALSIFEIPPSVNVRLRCFRCCAPSRLSKQQGFRIQNPYTTDEWQTDCIIPSIDSISNVAVVFLPSRSQ